MFAIQNIASVVVNMNIFSLNTNTHISLNKLMYSSFSFSTARIVQIIRSTVVRSLPSLSTADLLVNMTVIIWFKPDELIWTIWISIYQIQSLFFPLPPSSLFWCVVGCQRHCLHGRIIILWGRVFGCFPQILDILWLIRHFNLQNVWEKLKLDQIQNNPITSLYYKNVV